MTGDKSRAPVRPITCASEEETVRLGRSIGAALRAGDTLFAEGELGAGKTCLIRGVCAGLGYSGRVRSPSFSVVNRYEGRVVIYHVDLYRIPYDSPELEDISRQEPFSGESVALVEWGEKLRRWGVVPSASVRVETAPDEVRRLEVRIEDPDLARRLEGLDLLG